VHKYKIPTSERHFFVGLQFLVTLACLNEVAFSAESYSPYVEQPYPSNVYWGDTHLHTNMSFDANGYGNKKLGSEEAYRFAKGKVITAHNGMDVRLRRPLDFLVIADHALNLGVMPRLEALDPVLLNTEVGKRWRKKMTEYPLSPEASLYADKERLFDTVLSAVGGSGAFFTKAWSTDYFSDIPIRQTIWAEVASNADRHNEPGKFTAFSGYEWTPKTPAHYHRVVIFKDSAEKVTRVLPFSYYDSNNPEKLWAFLSSYEKETGGEAFAIPHNGNVSDGLMFALKDIEGNPFNARYAKVRARWEPLYEVTQIKGDGETHPVLSPEDEFADYETWNSWYGSTMQGVKTEGWKERKKAEYARSALKMGLGEQARLGANPFKFGMIGSTDSHTALATADEDNFWGKISLFEPGKYRLFDRGLLGEFVGWDYAASGYAAVWAEENTRDALFAAMKRKETYATTGPRMTVRFFGGWEYKTDDALKPDFARIGYSKGVPMGGDLTHAPKGKAPTFLIRAVKDPDGANLDRVQVIKGWHDKNGELHEKIYNVALSNGRKEDWRGKVKSVGSTVDVGDASYTNSIGDSELAVVWSDPYFDKDELAFYYLRVLEIPTPRWTAYDAKFFELKDIPDEVPMVTQERAYTSPIWYSP